MNALFEGILLGFTLAFILGFGPAFFALVQTATHRGFWAGILLAFGIFLNDLVIVVLGLLGSVNVIKGSENYKLMGIIGGAVLIVFGMVTFSRKRTSKDAGSTTNGNLHRLFFIVKGFLLNLLNPFVWVFWLTVIVSATATYKANTNNLMLFFGGTLSVVFLSDMFKVFMASKLSAFLTDKFLNRINKVAGVALVIFGLLLIVRAVFGF